MKKYYAVLVIETAHAVSIGSEEVGDLPLSWADGQVGAIAVFSNKLKARRYAQGRMVIELLAGEGK